MPRKRSKPKQLSLSNWRQMAPRDFARIADDLIALIAPMTKLAEDKENLVMSAISGRFVASAALTIAIRLEAQYGSDSGLSWTWLAIAAHRGSAPACQFLALRLFGMANDVSYQPFGVQGPENRRKAAQLRRLAFLWLAQAARGDRVRRLMDVPRIFVTNFGKPPKSFVSGNTQVPPLRGHLPGAATPSDDSAPSPSVPTLKVLRGDIIAARGEDKVFLDSWAKALANPLPLLGGDVDPKQIGMVLEMEFPWAGAAVRALLGDLRFRQDAGIRWIRIRPTLLADHPALEKPDW